MRVSASIMAGGSVREAAADAKRWGADFIHFDVMDGRFVPGRNYTPKEAQVAAGAGLPLDVHIMAQEPTKLIGAYAKAGATMISVHAEAEAPLETIAKIKGFGIKAGLAVNPETEINSIPKRLVAAADFILVMGVHPGRAGQKYIAATTAKIRAAKKMISARQYIEVDGGVNGKNMAAIANAGASVLVMGSALYCSDDPEKLVEKAKML